MTRKSPPKKPSRKSPEKVQYQRFLATAREVGASKDPKDLEKAVKQVAPSGKPLAQARR